MFLPAVTYEVDRASQNHYLLSLFFGSNNIILMKRYRQTVTRIFLGMSNKLTYITCVL